jgi:hypothetical protein
MTTKIETAGPPKSAEKPKRKPLTPDREAPTVGLSGTMVVTLKSGCYIRGQRFDAGDTLELTKQEVCDLYLAGRTDLSEEIYRCLQQLGWTASDQ